ncbi:cache domain-containing protein [uncultured Leclercia sp.]|uniref:cache domain-containing protein n=1 Tax=uncultured Leclercia sp. TaxID=332959 RepID=UPI00259452D4|nr:cache domain-containing protein [uncultured Leclercia sp.]
MSFSKAVSTLIDKIEDVTHSTVHSTVLLANAIQEAITRHPKGSVQTLLDPTLKALIQQEIKQTVNTSRYCSGAGFASHIEATATFNEYWLLEWWYKKANGLNQVNLDIDQATQQRLDFRTFEWFKLSPLQGEAFIHGPYVDYICNTSYTLTAAVPVYHEGHFVGVAASDILVGQLEEELLACSSAKGVILTNLENRIIFSSQPQSRVGDLLQSHQSEVIFESDYFRLHQITTLSSR